MNQKDQDRAMTARRLARPFWLLFGFSALGLLALTAALAHGLNKSAVEASEHLFMAHVAAHAEALETLTLEYGYWDEAVENMVETVNQDWIDANLGYYIHETVGVDRVYVLDGDDQTVFASRNSEVIQADAVSDYGMDLAALASAVRSDPPEEDPVPRSVMLMESDVAHFVTVARMTSYTAEENLPTDHVIVFTQPLDGGFLATARDALLLNDVDFAAMPKGVWTAAHPIRLADGEVAGYITWRPELPGTKIVPVLGFGVILAISIMALTANSFMRRVSATARMLEAARAEADRASAAKSDFLRNVTHELRTPVNAVIGFSQVMKNEMYGPLGSPKYREYTADITSAGNHILSLVDDLLDLARIEAGEMTFEYGPVDIECVLADALALVEGLAKDKGVVLNMPKTEGIPLVRSDARAVRQIAVNLLSNAIKFTPPGGSVACELGSTADDGITIRISDTGIGIAADDIPRILEPFVQVRSEEAEKSRGSGLGLPITKKIAEALGGRLALASSPGAGTIATVVLPMEA